jgi:transcriptional regulator with XRE-family HTH domain
MDSHPYRRTTIDRAKPNSSGAATRQTVLRTFGRFVKRARLEAGLSQWRLASAAHIDRAYLSHIERGMRAPTIGVIFALSKTLGLAPGALVRKTSKFLLPLTATSHVSSKTEARRGTHS